MLNSLGYNLTRLVVFSGRERRGLFWPYAGVVLAVMFVVVGVVMNLALAPFFAEAQTFAAEHPDQVTVTQSPTSYSVQIDGAHPELMPDLGAVFGGMSVCLVIIVLLLAAAVARRLHDRGRSGLWGLAPVVFLGLGVGGMAALMSNMSTDAGVGAGEAGLLPLFLLIFFNNMVYLASLAFLVVQLAMPGTPGPNRFGEPNV